MTLSNMGRIFYSPPVIGQEGVKIIYNPDGVSVADAEDARVRREAYEPALHQFDDVVSRYAPSTSEPKLEVQQISPSALKIGDSVIPIEQGLNDIYPELYALQGIRALANAPRYAVKVAQAAVPVIQENVSPYVQAAFSKIPQVVARGVNGVTHTLSLAPTNPLGDLSWNTLAKIGTILGAAGAGEWARDNQVMPMTIGQYFKNLWNAIVGKSAASTSATPNPDEHPEETKKKEHPETNKPNEPSKFWKWVQDDLNPFGGYRNSFVGQWRTSTGKQVLKALAKEQTLRDEAQLAVNTLKALNDLDAGKSLRDAFSDNFLLQENHRNGRLTRMTLLPYLSDSLIKGIMTTPTDSVPTDSTAKSKVYNYEVGPGPSNSTVKRQIEQSKFNAKGLPTKSDTTYILRGPDGSERELDQYNSPWDRQIISTAILLGSKSHNASSNQ